MGGSDEVKDFVNSAIIVNKKDEVLLIRLKKKEIGKNGAVLEWTFPSARQRLDESRTDCVKRGVLGKTGYEIEPVKEISSRVHPQFFIFVVYHRCRLISEKPIARPKETNEVAEIKWVKKEEIKKLITSNLDKDVSKELGLK